MTDKKRILAVDDDPSTRDLYEKGLPLYGYDVSCAPSAEKAREQISQRKPDLIIMDIMMPDQDGISFTREVRSDLRTTDVPILVVSGLADAATLNDALLFGAVDYVVKPIDLDLLKLKIERAFAVADRRKKK